MCGRYSLVQVEQLQERFQLDSPVVPTGANPDIRPTNREPVIVFDPAAGRRRSREMRWGLIPTWSKDARIAARTFNARAETLLEKPAFKGSMRARRCLVPADAFFEWRDEGGPKKVRYRFALADGALFAFAGLWSSWRDPDGAELETYTIITTEPNELMAQYHNRMPVILRPDDESRWVDEPDADPFSLLALLQPFPAELMQVSS